MSNEPVDAIVASFKSEETANQVARQIRQSGKDKVIKLYGAAVVKRDEKGKLHLDDPSDAGAVKGMLGGGLIGAVAAVIFPPLVIPVALGALFGGIAAKLHDGGLPDAQLKQIGAILEKGAAAVVALVDPADSDAVNKMLAEAGADVVSIGLNEETLAKLAEAQSPQPDGNPASE